MVMYPGRLLLSVLLLLAQGLSPLAHAHQRGQSDSGAVHFDGLPHLGLHTTGRVPAGRVGSCGDDIVVPDESPAVSVATPLLDTARHPVPENDTAAAYAPAVATKLAQAGMGWCCTDWGRAASFPGPQQRAPPQPGPV